jgi:hypothetical protein
MRHNRLAIVLTLVLAIAVGQLGLWAQNAQADSPETILSHIRVDIQHLLANPQPELYERHLRSVLALCEDSVLKLRFVEADRDAQTKELEGYLRTIESGLRTDDTRNPETYLAEGRRSLDLARLSRSDGTLQFYAVSLPAHWGPNKSCPLYVELHGRWSDLPLALVASTFATQDKNQNSNDDAIIVVPWVRGNSQYRLKNGSEPDIWKGEGMERPCTSRCHS